jgi:NADPH2:quinone reductase
MKAAVYRQNGGPEVLSYETVPDPVPSAHEVLVRNEAISIEGGDLLSRFMMPLPASPHVVGYGSAGEIVAIGSAVTDLRIGQHVAAYGHAGSHAALRVVRADHCWVLPDGLDPQAAACVPVAFGTAYEALFEHGRLEAGQTVLLQGVAGGVSLAALMLAKQAGARVIGTASSERQLEVLRGYGLDEGINYISEDLHARVMAVTDGRGVDLSIDPVAGSQTQKVIDSTRRGGRIVLVGASSRERSPIDATSLVRGNLFMSGFMLSEHYHTQRVRQYIGQILHQIGLGKLKVVIDRAFPLADAVEAHRYAEQRGRVGRVVMIP